MLSCEQCYRSAEREERCMHREDFSVVRSSDGVVEAEENRLDEGSGRGADRKMSKM